MSLCTENAPAVQDTPTSQYDTHLYCPWCYPNPQLGDTVNALCGLPNHFLGQRPANGRECPACLALEAQVLAYRGCPNCRD